MQKLTYMYQKTGQIAGYQTPEFISTQSQTIQLKNLVSKQINEQTDASTQKYMQITKINIGRQNNTKKQNSLTNLFKHTSERNIKSNGKKTRKVVYSHFSQDKHINKDYSYKTISHHRAYSPLGPNDNYDKSQSFQLKHYNDNHLKNTHIFNFGISKTHKYFQLLNKHHQHQDRFLNQSNHYNLLNDQYKLPKLQTMVNTHKFNSKSLQKFKKSPKYFVQNHNHNLTNLSENKLDLIKKMSPFKKRKMNALKNIKIKECAYTLKIN